MRAWRVDRRMFALVVDFGEPFFHRYQTRLGAPAMRYFAGDGRKDEVARQWHVRRGLSARTYLWLRRALLGKPDGEVVVVAHGARRDDE